MGRSRKTKPKPDSSRAAGPVIDWLERACYGAALIRALLGHLAATVLTVVALVLAIVLAVNGTIAFPVLLAAAAAKLSTDLSGD
jgi:hypothetical protein